MVTSEASRGTSSEITTGTTMPPNSCRLPRSCRTSSCPLTYLRSSNCILEGGGLHTRAPTSRVSIGLTTSAGSPLFIYLIGQTPLQSLECRGDIFPEVRHVSLKPFGIHYLYRDKKRKHTNDGHY